uniref:Uncharacterized protein n=1 Tax=Anguilla anguilla TaxID=7936 RepID=A0A0E9P918_ANGAN
MRGLFSKFSRSLICSDCFVLVYSILL